jgi:hypothetical protein
VGIVGGPERQQARGVLGWAPATERVPDGTRAVEHRILEWSPPSCVDDVKRRAAAVTVAVISIAVSSSGLG